jgi:hypothetical protein
VILTNARAWIPRSRYMLTIVVSGCPSGQPAFRERTTACRSRRLRHVESSASLFDAVFYDGPMNARAEGFMAELIGGALSS